MESFACEIDRSQSRHIMLGFVAGVELLPANTIIPIHPIKHPLQSLVVQSSPLSQSATYPASISIGRIYERPGANIADKDHTVKVPQKIILMDR